MGANEADIEKIKNLFMSILRDIKKDFPNDPSGAAATAAAVQGIREALPDKPEVELTTNDVSAAMAAYVGTVAPMDEESRALFQELAKRMLEQAGMELMIRAGFDIFWIMMLLWNKNRQPEGK